MLSDLGLTIILVLLNGFFVGAEFAMVKVRASQLELLVRSGSLFARFAQTISSNINAYLSATQLGITLASLGLGWFGERMLSSHFFAGSPITLRRLGGGAMVRAAPNFLCATRDAAEHTCATSSAAAQLR